MDQLYRLDVDLIDSSSFMCTSLRRHHPDLSSQTASLHRSKHPHLAVRGVLLLLLLLLTCYQSWGTE